MKGKIRKNQVVIATLAVLIAIAGYISYDKKGIDWKTVAAAAGCSVRSMLVPDGVVVPESSGIKLFQPQVLPLLIMLNTAAIRLDKGDITKNKLIIFDRNGMLPDYLDRVVMSAARITVVTDCPEKYYPCLADLMESHGVGVRVCSAPDPKMTYDVAVTWNESANALLCLDAADLPMHNLILPEEYVRMCPQGIDNFLFVCALFECCGFAKAGDLTLRDV